MSGALVTCLAWALASAPPVAPSPAATARIEAPTADDQIDQIEPLATAVRGITGVAEFTAAGAQVRGHSGQTIEWPLVARVVSVESNPGDEARTRYRVAFIGTVAGDFDLRTCLERHDGTPLDLPPLPVRVVTQLVPEQGTDLFPSAQPAALDATAYRPLMITLAVVWLSVPLLYLAIRIARRRPAPRPPVVAPPPTLADQLRPLVNAAMEGTLSVAGRGRLELLLYLYWRERLALSGSQPQVITLLRTHPQAGELLQAVERWLHAPRAHAGSPAAESVAVEAEVALLLEPYRNAPQIEPLAAAEEAPA